MKPSVELLSGAGSMESARAAFSAGADAVYLGLKKFGARKMAENFSPAELAEVTAIAGALGRRVYLTLNTLVLDGETGEFIAALETARECGVDAVIMQDAGMMALTHKLFPALEIHASTQANAHNAESVARLARMGVKRVILSRECDLEEIRRICDRSPIAIETFVAGALCSAMSGVCYMSSLATNRSGNRGMCAQMCRLKYSFAGKEGFFLSTRDQSLLGHLGELRDAGVSSFKIEGRGRSASYIYNVTSAFREALDLLLAGRYSKADAARLEEKMCRTYNRTFCQGYAEGREKCNVINSRRNGNNGLLVSGAIDGMWPETETIRFKLLSKIAKNDLLEFEATDGKRFLVKIESIFDRRRQQVFSAGKGDMASVRYRILKSEDAPASPSHPHNIKAVYLVHSEEASSIRKLKLPDGARPAATPSNDLDISVSVSKGAISLSIKCHGLSFDYRISEAQTHDAEKHGLTPETIINTFFQFDRSRFTAAPDRTRITIEPGIFVPLSVLKKYGRETFAKFHSDFDASASAEKRVAALSSSSVSREFLGLGTPADAKKHPAHAARPTLTLSLFAPPKTPISPSFDRVSTSAAWFIDGRGRYDASLMGRSELAPEKMAVELMPVAFEREEDDLLALIAGLMDAGVTRFTAANGGHFEMIRRAAKKSGRHPVVDAGAMLNIVNIHSFAHFCRECNGDVELSFELNHDDITAFLDTLRSRAPELLCRVRIRLFGHINTAVFAYDFFAMNPELSPLAERPAHPSEGLMQARIDFNGGAHYILRHSASKSSAYSAVPLNMTSYASGYAGAGVEHFAFSLYDHSARFDRDLANASVFAEEFALTRNASPIEGIGIKKDMGLK